MKILIVDNDKLAVVLLQSMLEMQGNTCDSAGNSIEALDLFQKNRYDLVLMDILLPDSNGIEAMKAIRRLCPGIPVVAITTFLREEYREMLLCVGFDGCLSKPYQAENLEKILHEGMLI
ncbi:MAG: response regulator [bacterium]|nr:response regulator [bacterium]